MGVREIFELTENRENKMAGIKTILRVPEFDRENIQMYIDELTIWALVTEVDKNKQGPLV